MRSSSRDSLTNQQTKSYMTWFVIRFLEDSSFGPGFQNVPNFFTDVRL